MKKITSNAIEEGYLQDNPHRDKIVRG